MQRTPAGLLILLITGMPGIGDEIEGAVQQAPHPERHFMACDGPSTPPSR